MWSGCTWFKAKKETEGQTILLPSSFFQEWESDTTVGKRNPHDPFLHACKELVVQRNVCTLPRVCGILKTHFQERDFVVSTSEKK